MKPTSNIISLSDYAGTPLTKAYQPLELEKAGEGSRGGTIVGHTKSGKPIYHSIGESKQHDHHYTVEDHQDAASHHRQAQKKYETAPGKDTASAEGKVTMRDRIAHHNTNANYHEMHADILKEKQGVVKQKSLPEKNTPEWHKLKIAKDTMKMNPAMSGVMGGPSHAEAEKTLKEYGLTKSEDAYELLGLKLEKSGEGSKGGHVIGHTKSGKPVYAEAGIHNKEYKGFSAQDHSDAAELHFYKHNVHTQKSNGTIHTSGTRESEQALAAHHVQTAKAHNETARVAIQNEHEAGLSESEKKIIAEQKKQAGHHKEMMAHHETMFKHAVQQQLNHKTGSSQHSAFQAEQEKHLAEYQRHEGEHKRLTGK